MNRRTLLSALGGFVAGGTAVSLYGSDKLRAETTRMIQRPVDKEPPVTMQLGGPFKEITFYQDGTAGLLFEQFHDADGFYVKYHQEESIKDAILSCQSPKSGSEGETTVDIISAIQNENINYPDRRFDIVAASGAFDDCSYSQQYTFTMIQDELYTATVPIPTAFELSP